jgi:hypothetical protein
MKRTRMSTTTALLMDGGTRVVRTVKIPHHTTAKVRRRREAMGKQSGRYLEDSVSDEEGAEDPAQVGVVDPVLLAYLDSGDRDVSAVEVGDGAEEKKEDDEEIAHGQSGGGLPVLCHAPSNLTLGRASLVSTSW